MLDVETKSRINTARDILVGKVPDPKSQVEQITIALIYKFMDDMDVESEELGGKRTFFTGEYAKYAWRKIFDPRQSGYDLLNLYSEAIAKMDVNPGIPRLFRDIFKNAYLPYRDPETLKSFLKIINEFDYSHSEKLGDAFEFLLSILGSQGEAGQFRTPRHIIDFMVEIVDPKKNETILDPACGTAGFLISSYKHIIKQNSSNYKPELNDGSNTNGNQTVYDLILSNNGYTGDKLSAEERKILADNMHGYDISPDMVRLSLVNMYLHGIKEPHISEYDTLTSEDNWNHYSDVILANPPFMSPKGGIKPHKRFSVQSNRSEVLFVDYIAEHLTPEGRAAVIVPEGIIFQSGNAYKQLRKMLVEKYLVGVISLPAGVFQPYSGVKTSILWFDKVLAKKTDKILFVKIENDGFDLGAQRRAIKGSDLPAILQTISVSKNQLSLGKQINFNKNTNILLIARHEIYNTGDFNLSGERYNVKDNYSNVYPMVKLESLYDFIRGVTYTKSDEVDKNGIPILRANNINLTSGNLDFSDIRYISNYVKVKEEQRLLKDDILMCTASGSADHIGKVAYSDDDTKFYFGGFMGVLRANFAKILPRFLFVILKTQKFREYIAGITVGANIRNIKSSILDSFEIPLPPLSIQKEIVAEIDSFQKIIDGARLVVENYKPRIEIDPEWEMVELVELIKLSSGNALTAQNMVEGPYPVYGGNGINGYHNAYLLDVPTIVIGRVGAYCGSIHITEPKSWITDNALYVTEFIKEVDIEFLAHLFEQLNFNQYAKVGGQPSVSQKTITELKAPIPPVEIQHEIAIKLKHEESLINANIDLISIYEQKIKDRIAKVWGE